MLVVNGEQEDSTPVRVLTSRVSELEKLQEANIKLQKLMVFNNGIEHYGVSKKI